MAEIVAKSVKIAIDNAIELFDEIFYEIAPIDSYNEPNKAEGVKIPLKHLTDLQCRLIKEFSGHLSTARASLLVNGPPQGTSQSHKNEAALLKKVNCLREYLVNELNRSEAAEQQLKKKEEELVLITAERDKLQKKLASATNVNGGSGNAGSNRNIANVVGTSSVKTLHGDRVDAHPESYVHSYIRKPFGNAFFFGLVAQYDAEHSYFQVVYEDADYEDLSHTEMRKVLWSGSTPNSKKEACMKHAKLMGMLTEEQYVQIVEANKYSSSASKSAGSSSSSLHSVSASSSSSSAPGTTSRSGRATTRHQQASGAAVSADEAHEAHTVSADDDNMEITSETTQTPSVSRRSSLSPSPSSSLLLPIEPSPRMTAAQSGGAVPARALAGAGVGVGVVSDMSAGTDGDSRDSADSLSKPLSVPVVIAVNANANTGASASGGADEGLMSPSAKTRSTPSYSAPAKNAAPSVIMKTTSSDVNSKKVPATSTSTLTKTPALSKSSSSAAAPVAANAADNNKIKNSITSTAGAAGGRGGIGTNEMPKLAQLQAMLLATPAAALSSVTSSEKVKPAAKPILQQQTIKLAPAVQPSTTTSGATQKNTVASSGPPRASASTAPSGDARVLPTSLTSKSTAPAITTSNSRSHSNSHSSSKSKQMAAQRTATNTASDSEDSSVVFVGTRPSPDKKSQQQQQQQKATNDNGNNSKVLHGTTSKVTDAQLQSDRNAKRKANALSGMNPLPVPNKKQHSTASPLVGVKTVQEYFEVEE